MIKEPKALKLSKVKMRSYSKAERKRIINQMETLLDLNYSVPGSSLHETEEGYIFNGKDNVTIELDPKEVLELLIKFKKEI